VNLGDAGRSWGDLDNDVSAVSLFHKRALTLFRRARSRSRTLLPLYLRNLPRLSVKTLSSRLYQSCPITPTASSSSDTSKLSGGSSSMISKRSEASQRKARRLAGVQKKGCCKHSEVVGLESARSEPFTHLAFGSRSSNRPISCRASHPSSPRTSRRSMLTASPLTILLSRS
jgi:hypothetical protein